MFEIDFQCFNLQITNESQYKLILRYSFSVNHTVHHGLINYKDTKAKCRHLKKLTCKGTLRQVFIRVYRLEIQSVRLIFSTCPFTGQFFLDDDIFHCLL
jgi:hypothetical protein